jgi:hypothetical protein
MSPELTWWTAPAPGDKVPKETSSETAKRLIFFSQCKMSLLALNRRDGEQMSRQLSGAKRTRLPQASATASDKADMRRASQQSIAKLPELLRGKIRP